MSVTFLKNDILGKSDEAEAKVSPADRGIARPAGLFLLEQKMAYGTNLLYPAVQVHEFRGGGNAI